MNTQKSDNSGYPRFIQNKPCGIDKFDGGSQTKLARAIAKHFITNDSYTENALPRIIGIQGEWGAGKSNVVKLLKKELEKKYYFFEYDAWGHQEDLQRRSILELLTSQLITDSIIYGNATIKIKGGEEKTVTWEEKLKYLLARKTETITEKYPQLNNSMAIALLAAVLTPIFTFIAYAIKPTESTWLFCLLSILIAALPLIASLFVWWRIYRKNKSYGLSYLLAIYNKKIENDICYETLSEDEPTVREFKAWMSDISSFIKKNNKPNLVIIFDNMDRLPADKVKELWSSIHTFFADDGFDNIWAVIPFDNKHLSCAFGYEGSKEAQELTKYFINKTFPIVYRVAPPVITDFRSLFDKLFIEAFGNTEKENQGVINRIYRLVYPKANVRDIITFINGMVALKQEKNNEISIINIAVFLAYQEEILAEPITQILSGEYLKKISSIIVNDMQTQREISALVYGVGVDLARQIPLTRYIESCIQTESGYDINKYADSNISFDTVLEEVITNIDDAIIDKAINCLGSLRRKSASIKKLWENLGKRKLDIPLEKQEFTQEYQLLLTNIDDNEILNKTTSTLYEYLFNFNEFKGEKYYSALNSISMFIQDHKLACELVDSREKHISAEVFIDYVRAAKSNYTNYKVKTDAKELDLYLAEKIILEEFTHSDFIAIIGKDSQYKFTELVTSIEQHIENKKIDITNFWETFKTYKLLSEEKPLKKTLALSEVSRMASEMQSNNYEETPEYCDIVAMQISNGWNVATIKEDEEFISTMANVIDYYADYGNLLVNCINWNIPLLNKVLQYITINRLGVHLDFSQVIPFYESIKNKINVTDEQFISQLSDWENNASNWITKENIKKEIPSASFYEITTKYENNLTSYINKIALEALSEIDSSYLYNQRNSHDSDYWHITTKYLINNKCMTLLPDNITEFGKKILLDIPDGTQTLPLNDYYLSIISKLDKRKIVSTIKDMRNKFCNGQTIMNTSKFKFLESWLRQQGHLNERSGDVTDKILKPIINDIECRALILANKEFYISLINESRDEANDLRQNFSNNIKETKDAQLLTFAKQIGIVFDSESK